MKTSTRSRKQKPPATGKLKVEATEEEAPILLSTTLPGGGPGEWNEGVPLRATVLLHAPEEIARFIRLFAEGLGYIAEHLALEVNKIANTIEARIEEGRGQLS